MTSTIIERPPTPVSTDRLDRAGAVACIAYVVLLVTGVAVLGTPEGDAPDSAWLVHYSDAASRQQTLAGGLVVVLAGLAFLVALGRIADRVQAAHRSLLLAVGTAHGLLVVAAGMAGASMALVKDLAGMPVPRDPDLLRLSDALMFGTLLLPGLLTAGLVAWVLARSAGLPALLRRSGLVVAVLSIAGLALLPALLWLVWFAVAGVVLATRTVKS